MLSHADSRLLMETGPGAPMGRFMREFWIPVMRGARLTAGGAPQRLTILGEKLVAYRSPDGRVGVMDEACPHRGASMALARNEDCGLRCVYHGWLVGHENKLLDAPTHPEGARIDRIPMRTHPARESQGMVWAWLGKGEPAEFPKLAFTDLPDDHVVTTTTVVNTNWLQPLETLWDTFHAQVLHNQTNRASARASVYFSDNDSRMAGDLKFNYPEMRVRRTEYGMAYTNADVIKDTNFEFIVPFTLFNTVTPNPLDDRALQISVPIDDRHTLLWIIMYNRNGPLKPDGMGRMALGSAEDPDDTMSIFGPRTPENLWGQDRDAMSTRGSFNGIVDRGMQTITAEDIFVIESQTEMDGAPDRSKDNLSPIDRALVEGRRVLIDAVQAYERGEPPMGRGLDLTDVEALYVVKPQEVAAQ